MDLAADFSFQPLPAVQTPVAAPSSKIASPLGPLAGLAGKWVGRGFNVIWRPDSVSGQDRFLELNVTSEQLEFSPISGPIPNRGFLQGDINMFGLTYLQQISDANLKAGLHIEPGLWAAVPKTSDPNVPPTVIRLASIRTARRSCSRASPARRRPARQSPTSASSRSRSITRTRPSTSRNRR